MKTEPLKTGCARGLLLVAALLLLPPQTRAHVVAPEQFHPVVESYRRAMFLLNLNPVLWDEVKTDAERIAIGLETVSTERAAAYRKAVAEAIAVPTAPVKEGEDAPGPDARQQAARAVFELSTRAVAELLTSELEKLKASTSDRKKAAECLELSRQYWAGFEYEIKSTDQPMFREIGLCWLKMTTALGSAPLLGQGEAAVDAKTIQEESGEILAYVKTCYADFHAPEGRVLAPVPLASKSFDARAGLAAKLPPGSNINKQRPRPRQILNLVARGVDETETPLVAFGDMAFDSSLIFGEPARSLGLSCNNCHNKSITNPQFKIPGLTKYDGGLDVSSAFFAPHANNGHFDPLDIPDLRGIRFTAPYGRNGRFASLRDFIRNVIVNEFNGPEPDPIVVDAMLAYMMEFDFLPNPMLNKDGTLNEKAPQAARRGEKLFNKSFAQMNGMSCASCHVPSGSFVDHQRHDIGSVTGAEEHSLDRALDTPTLLSAKYTQPYFHDGSLATLKDVVLWFDTNYKLKLDKNQVADLTAYLETVGDGSEAYEENPDVAAPAEVEEQNFFMASWEFLRDKGKFDLADLLFRTVAQELRNEKWGLKYAEATEVVERMAQLADAAAVANKAGQVETVTARVLEFRKLYEENTGLISGDEAPGEKKTAQVKPATTPTARLTPTETQQLVDDVRGIK
ncbi:MAG: cytochrome C [Chloroflexi bacterium]|nr:cytochrome C [Chloroflexota bacterium]